MIYTKAAWTTTSGICDGGYKRTVDALAKHGLTMDSDVSMQTILAELGLSDTLFSFCKVKKGGEVEAAHVLGKYMQHVAGYAFKFLSYTTPIEEMAVLAKSNKPINKRADGIKQTATMAHCYKLVNKLYQKETHASSRFLLDVYRIILSDKPEHLKATHASIALMDACAVHDARKECHDTLVKVLSDLLGPDTNATQ